MSTLFPNAPDVSATDYLVVGLATCFIKAEGEVLEIKVVEPIPSAALEAIVKQIPTSYEVAYGTTLGELLADNTLHLPSEFSAEAQFGGDFVERAVAAARTYKRRPSAQSLIPQGTYCRELNYSVERKRVLNSKRSVKLEDNVKQHEYTHKVL